MLTQTKVMSFVEACVNTLVGFFISVTVQWVIMNLIMHIPVTVGQFFWLSFWMTIISVLRGYVLRRLFNSEFWKRWKRGRHPAVQTCSQES